MKKRQIIGLFVGFGLFIMVLLLPVPEGATPPAMRAAAVTLLMATWWITEAIPISATALIPLVFFPVLGVLTAQQTAMNYGHNYVLMLLGGFFIAKAFELHNLHQRMALVIIKWLGTSRRRIMLSFMIATAFLSFWIANVAVALLMLPLGIAIIEKESGNDSRGEQDSKFGLALMLSIAYAASIGGIGTLIGTPPNMVFVGVVNQMFPKSPEISFLQWMTVGIPLVLIFLPVAWLYLINLFKIKGSFEGSKDIISRQLKKLGPMSKAEKRVMIIFIITAFGWVFRRDIPLQFVKIPGWSSLLHIENYVHDSTVAIFSSLLMFLIPSGIKNENGKTSPSRLLDWKSAERIPWGVVWIVAGGYAIAMSFKETGLAAWIGHEISLVALLPTFLVILIIVFSLTFLTEINSNTATANIFLPILATMAVASSIHPYLLMIPGTIACSCAFMLPSGTGTNAVIFGSDKVTIPEMARTGFLLNFISIIIVTLIMYLVAVPIFGISHGIPVWARY